MVVKTCKIKKISCLRHLCLMYQSYCKGKHCNGSDIPVQTKPNGFVASVYKSYFSSKWSRKLHDSIQLGTKAYDFKLAKTFSNVDT